MAKIKVFDFLITAAALAALFLLLPADKDAKLTNKMHPNLSPMTPSHPASPRIKYRQSADEHVARPT